MVLEASASSRYRKRRMPCSSSLSRRCLLPQELCRGHRSMRSVLSLRLKPATFSLSFCRRLVHLFENINCLQTNERYDDCMVWCNIPFCIPRRAHVSCGRRGLSWTICNLMYQPRTARLVLLECFPSSASLPLDRGARFH